MKISAERLHEFISASLIELKVPAGDAAIVADSFVEAELEGQSGHGVIRLPFLLERLKSGLIDPHPPVQVVTESASAALLDGGNGLGPVVGVKALGIAVAKARDTGVGLCAVRRSNHLGAVGFYVQRAAREGLIALGFGNTPPAMAPPGGAMAVLGTNPIAAAFPTRADEAIPADWALDAQGRATTDAAAAIMGSLRPLGGAKGFALALVVEALSGVLAGAAIGPGVGGTYLHTDKESNLGHSFLVIDPAALGSGFEDRMTGLADVIRGVEPLDPDQPVRIPGDRRRAESEARMRDGIVLPDHIVHDIEAAAARAL